ncbi:phage antirepressor [Pseudomonas aeruginosa]|uniref:phage antirepressor n=1 Tax=Pseudomonas aeruginosa TaxID=287 RepID=UPI0028DA077E|nr:phage antirepressor [Pseudomonas aeruginosa]MDT8512053.1 phage antirepressor [Pseudomonas aeruginosa]
MTGLTSIGGQSATMTTIELRDMVNEARLAAGEPKIRNDQFLARVEDELGDELEGVQKYYTPFHGNQVATYDLTLDQCMLVGMRESKSVRRSVLAKLKSRRPPMTQAEQLLAHAQLQVQLERRQQQIEQQQAQHQVAIERVEQRVEDLSESRVWDHCPQNCMPITRIREVINDRYGLSATVVDAVVRQMPISPKPWGMVRNGHENAQGSQYAVWATSDITAVFKRFVSECERVTETQATHPYFPGRFRLAPKVKS